MKSLFDDENMCHGRPKIALPASGDQNVYGWRTGGMKSLFDNENMCHGRPKIALPASGDQNVYYGLDTKILLCQQS
jgi:cytochrome c5